MMMAILMTGSFLFGAGQVKAQEDCKSLAAESNAQRNCWVKKAKSGELNLAGAYLSEADLTSVDLRDANLNGANLSRAVLAKCILTRATLKKANLSGANLGLSPAVDMNGFTSKAGADLTHADFNGADLSGADFRGAELYRTHFGGANLIGANFSGANNFDTAYWSTATVSLSTTKGVDFGLWERRGGVVVK